MEAIQVAAEAKVNEIKAQIEEQAQADIEQLESCVEESLAKLESGSAALIEAIGDGLDDAMEAVEDASEAVDELAGESSDEDEEVEFISFLAAAANPEPEVSKATFVYAGMGLAGVATAAYLIMKKQEKALNEVNSALTCDEEFVQV